jgi:hypothetical protein
MLIATMIIMALMPPARYAGFPANCHRCAGSIGPDGGHDPTGPSGRQCTERLHESKAVAALSHSNIVVLHDVGADAGVNYAVTELPEGETSPEARAD